MKNINYFAPTALILFSLFLFNLIANANRDTRKDFVNQNDVSQEESVVTAEEAPLTMVDAIVPDGQTSRNAAFVEVAGFLPDQCHSISRAEVTNPSEFVHEIRLFALVKNQPCTLIVMPYSYQVVLGVLSAGTHLLRFINGDETSFEKTLEILSAN